MRIIRRLLGIRDYMFVIIQDKVLNDEPEKQLKGDIYKYIDGSLSSFFIRRKPVYSDYYIGKTGKTFSFLGSFQPEDNPWFFPLMYDIYAYSGTHDDNIFREYDYEAREFSNDFQTIKVLKFKLKA